MSEKLNGLKIHDSAFKFMIHLDPQGFLDKFEIPHKFRKILKTENVQKVGSQYTMDCLILVDYGNKIINIEFQSTYPNKEKLEIIKWYTILTEIEYNKEVITYIITIPPTIKEEHCNKLKSNIYHKTYEKSCKNLNGIELLNNIKHKLNNNKILTKEDQQNLILAPMQQIT